MNLEIPAKFVYHDQGVLLQVAGLNLDLSKIETVDEWNSTLVAIASQAVATSLLRSKPKPEQPDTEKPEPIKSAAEAMEDNARKFREQHADILRDTGKLREDLVNQYNELGAVHANALKNVTAADRGSGHDDNASKP